MTSRAMHFTTGFPGDVTRYAGGRQVTGLCQGDVFHAIFGNVS